MCKIYLELLIFAVALLGFVSCECPVNITKSCSCNEQPSGFYIKCNNVTVNLTTILQSIGKLRVQRLTVIGASWQRLQELPNVSIRSLQLIGCGIEEIENNAFDKLSANLEELLLNNNSIKSIPYIKNLHGLVSLNLNYNQLNEIPDGTFEGVVLRYLRIEGNNICTLSREALNETKGTLELLDISGNCLNKLPTDAINNCIKLMYLDLSDNNITAIGKSDVIYLPLLKELRLSNNMISRLLPAAFVNVSQLRYLYLQNNMLTSNDLLELFEVLKEIEVIDLSHNQITNIPSLKGLQSVRQVRFDSNKISRMEKFTFSTNPRMQLISLQNNRISAVSRGIFDKLDQLIVLLLANNSIRTIEAEGFNGMTNLQQLNLRNNSLSVLTNSTFRSLPNLTTIDVSYNGLHRIESGTFASLNKLYWLDLSFNALSAFEKGTFVQRVPNIILYGNPLYCDDKMNWLVDYLLLNHVRISLPYQPEVTCSAPEKYIDVRLTELRIKKANDTINAVRRTLKNGEEASAPLSPALVDKMIPDILIPFAKAKAAPSNLARVPVIGGISEAIPAMKNIPGLDFLPSAEGEQVGEILNLNSAIEQFSAPLVRVATAGGVPVSSDIEEMIKSIPNLVNNIPGFGNFDFSKLPANIIAHVLRGGQIPGIPKKVLEKMLKDYMKHMHAAAEAANRGRPLPDESRYLIPLEKLPPELVTSIMKGLTLPYLDDQQTNTVKEYYTSRLPTAVVGAKMSGDAPGLKIPQQLIDMMRLLPSGYDTNKIPKEVIESLSRGEVPNFLLLPSDLQHHLLANSHKLFAGFASRLNITIEDIMKKLPKFERPNLETFSPYSLEELNSGAAFAEKHAHRQHFHHYAAPVLVLMTGLTIAVVTVLCLRTRKERLDEVKMEDDDELPEDDFRISSPPAISTPKSVNNILQPFVSENTPTPSRRNVSHVSRK